MLFHPAKMGDELQAITPGSCVSRNADYEAFADPELGTFIEESGARLIGYRELRTHL